MIHSRLLNKEQFKDLCKEWNQPVETLLKRAEIAIPQKTAGTKSFPQLKLSLTSQQDT
jgi:hypothetical protein